MRYEPSIQFPLLPGDKLLLQWLVFSHSARNQCHGGNKGIECQIAGVSGSTKPFWSTARSLLGGWGNEWRVEEVGITGQQGQATQFLIPSENIALCQETCNSMLPFLLYWEKKKCKECKNSQENRLSGFLKELSWGSKQHGGSEDEVMTDGISGAWHNSPIWWSYPALYEC